MKKVFALLLAAVMLLTGIVSASALRISDNPLIDPNVITEYAETEDEYLNVLLLGIDHGVEFHGSGDRAKVLDVAKCHTDVVMLASVNLTKNTVNLISIPRDVLVYVPGVHGVYKLNAAYNCADSIEEGLNRSCETVSWLLGNVRIDKYVALDFDALIALGDAMGGIDYDMDVNFLNYRIGPTHLDGHAMLDYFRVRRNVSSGANDMGRTERGRKMVTAIMNKLYGEPALVAKLWEVAFSGNINFFTNLTVDDYASMYQVFNGLNLDEVGSYMLSGTYGLTGLSDWYFNILDQDVRLQVIRDAFGIEAEELEYVSMEYTGWLFKTGFPVANHIRIARAILDYGLSRDDLTADQQRAVKELEEAYDYCVEVYDRASVSMSEKDGEALTQARYKMRQKGEAAASKLRYMTDARWNSNMLWFRNPTVTDFASIDWQ